MATLFLNNRPYDLKLGDEVTIDALPGEVGCKYIFSSIKNTSVQMAVKEQRGDKTTFVVTGINDFPASDILYSMEEVQEEIQATSSIEIDWSSMTKKQLIEYIKQNNLDIDTKKTKAELVKELSK